MPIKVAYPIPESQPSVSVPSGHRAKCRKCGAVDNVKLSGSRRLKRCGACGSTIAMRRAPRKPKIVSFTVVYQADGSEIGRSSHRSLASAELSCRAFIDRGPVAHVRIAQLVEMLDGDATGNVRLLRYDNYKARNQSVTWQGGCSTCKGKGTLAVRVAVVDSKPIIRFIACAQCEGLGGELTREVNYRRFNK